MEIKDWQKERNSACKERYELSGGRLETILGEETVSGKYADYFRTVSSFLMQTEEVLESILDGSWEKKPLEEMRRINTGLYADILEDHYEDSYADPACACRKLGKYGQFLSALYAELRTAIPYAYEGRKDYLTILKELFIEVYNCFEAEKEPSLRELKRILYWYASDYSDVYLEDRILEQIDPDRSFAADIVRKSDLSDERFLYRYGEYVTEQETGTLRHLLSLPQETLQRIADVYTEGYRVGFINTGKDLSIKSTVNIRYCLGFEPVIRLAVRNFEKMGLKPTIYRAASGIAAGKGQAKIGY